MLCAGWIILTAALVSPLCPLSVSLFAARASQHVVLTMIAAPLIAAALVCVPPLRIARPTITASPLAAAFAFAITVWFWHAPAPYLLTFESVVAYWTMHVTMIASAVWLWLRLIGAREAPVETLLASLVSTVQMGFLGALITLAPRAFYAPHFLTTQAWGMTSLQDQQLGGIIMWVPGCLAFLVAAIASLRALLQRRGPGTQVAVAQFGHPV